MSELKSCPFCLSDDVGYWNNSEMIECRYCGASALKRFWNVRYESSKWVSVDDKPIPNYDVLLYGEEGCQVGDNSFDMCVTHWMPLPELPNE